MTVPDVSVLRPEWDGHGDEKRLLPSRVTVDGVEVFRHPIHPLHSIPVAVYMNSWIHEHPRSEDDRLVERLLIADDAPYHSRVFILERDNDEEALRLSDVHSSQYHITDMLPVVIDPNSVYPKHKGEMRMGMTYGNNRFSEAEVMLVVGKEVSNDGVLFLLDPLSAKQAQVLSKVMYCKYRGWSNVYDGKLRFDTATGTVWLDFHSNFVTLESEVHHSVNITRHLKKYGFCAEKTVVVHEGVRRANPVYIDFETAARAEANFYAMTSREHSEEPAELE